MPVFNEDGLFVRRAERESCRRSLYIFSDYTGRASSGKPSPFIFAFLFPSGFLFSVGLAHPFRPGLINCSGIQLESASRYAPSSGPEEKFSWSRSCTLLPVCPLSLSLSLIPCRSNLILWRCNLVNFWDSTVQLQKMNESDS